MPPRRYSDLQLACAVAESKNMREVLVKLGLVPRGGNYETVWRRIRALELSTQHFVASPGVASPVYDMPADNIGDAVAACRSKAGALRMLGLDDSPSNIRALGKIVEQLGLDISHHLGQGWRKGSKRPVRPAAPLQDVLVNGRPYDARDLKRRLVKEGIKEGRCERCRAARWFGKPLALELHHVNGDRHDNRLENLKLLCPNCHSLTDTYRGRNIGRMNEPPCPNRQRTSA